MQPCRSRECIRKLSGKTAGFSLVELLTATAVLIVLALILVNVTSHVGTLWSMEESQNQHRQRARAVLDFMSRELRVAALPIDPGEISLQLVINPSDSPSIGAEFLNHDAIFWQAPIGNDARAGNLAEVGYFVQWHGNQPKLCRFYVDPSDPNYLIYTAPLAWLSDDVLRRAAPADSANQYHGLFLENVLGLWVKATNADGTEYSGNSRSESNRPPSIVKISLVLANANVMEHLSDPGKIKSICAASATANDFVSHPGLPPSLRRGVSIVENVIHISGAR